VETLDDYRDHGEPEDRIEQEVVKAREVLDRLPELGINIDEATQHLEDEGVEKFSQSFERLMEALEKAVEKQAPEVSG
jgi:transaldolase